MKETIQVEVEYNEKKVTLTIEGDTREWEETWHVTSAVAEDGTELDENIWSGTSNEMDKAFFAMVEYFNE